MSKTTYVVNGKSNTPIFNRNGMVNPRYLCIRFEEFGHPWHWHIEESLIVAECGAWTPVADKELEYSPSDEVTTPATLEVIRDHMFSVAKLHEGDRIRAFALPDGNTKDMHVVVFDARDVMRCEELDKP